MQSWNGENVVWAPPSGAVGAAVAATPVRPATGPRDRASWGRSRSRERRARGLGALAAEVPLAGHVAPPRLPWPSSDPLGRPQTRRAFPAAELATISVTGLPTSAGTSFHTALVMPLGGGFVVDEPSTVVEVGHPIEVPKGTTVVSDCVLVPVGGRAVKARYLEEGTDVSAYKAARLRVFGEASILEERRQVREARHAEARFEERAGRPRGTGRGRGNPRGESP